MSEAALRSRIYALWVPLAFTWAAMAFENPLLNALAARLTDPTINLAAFGVAVGIVLLVESPIFGIVSAAIAIAEDRESLSRLTRFSHANGAALSAVVFLLSLDAVFTHTIKQIFQLDPALYGLIEKSLLIMSGNPFLVEYRRLYQGILVRSGRSKSVAFGTVVRLAAMAGTGIYLYWRAELSGAEVASYGLAAGIAVEALVARLMARESLREIASVSLPEHSHDLSFRGLGRFYYPLALSTVITLTTGPVISFFLARGALPLESLALFPVLNCVTLMFRSAAFAYQEVTVAILSQYDAAEPVLRKVMIQIGLVFSAALALLVLSPLGDLTFRGFFGLPANLVDLTRLPAAVLTVTPFFASWICFERGFFVVVRKTKIITLSGAIELGAISLVMWLGIYSAPHIGVNVSSAAMVVGAALSALWLAASRRAFMVDRAGESRSSPFSGSRKASRRR